MPEYRTERPTKLPLGNNIDIRFEDAKIRRILSDGLSLRGFIAAERMGDPIHAAVTADAVAEGGGTGDYIAEILGATARTHLEPLLYQTVWIVGESVPPGAYRDAFPVRVVEDQSA
jgi:hypothetical protein